MISPKTIGISQSAVYATFRRYNIPLDLFAKNVEKRICELRETMTIEAIAKEMNVSKNTILRSLKSCNNK